jgi:hypothetical protein
MELVVEAPVRPRPSCGGMPRGHIIGHHAPLRSRPADPPQTVEHVVQGMFTPGRGFRHHDQLGRDKSQFVARHIRGVGRA